jgi:hypothetical protein
MGLLDDAIREHLELKRRHGASTEEVDRQEREVLGEARRAEAEAEAEPLDAPEPPSTPFDAEEPQEREEPDDPWLDAERDEVPADEALDRPPADEVPEDEAPERPPTAEDAAEDVLEETPEFLQETPEHERLWFEQRPPRDFDWDK